MIPANQAAGTDLAEFVMLCGSKRSAAKLCGIPRKTLCRWLLDIERTGKINARPSRVRWAMERINAASARMRQDEPCYDVADAFMSIFGFQRAGRGDDMTCASFPGEDFVVSKDIEDGKRGFGPDMAKRVVSGKTNACDVTIDGGPVPELVVIRNSQTSKGETKERVNDKSVHKSRIGDGKARKSTTSKRIVVVSDLHCGHMVGLTPPGWWYSEHEALQREMWEWYENEMETIGEVDACFVVGDTIDGKGSRSGGVEQLTNDLIAQTDMATACLKIIQTDKYFMVHGTPYHVGPDGEHMERLVARNLGGTISGHEWVSVNGCVFDLKHKVGSSGVSYGRHTAVAKEKLWNTLWNLRKMAPKANVILRGHVHYYLDCGGIGWRAMTLPALQGPGSFYGVEQCSGIVDFGFVVFDVDADGKFKWEVHEYNPTIGEPVARVL
jgi:hypothetical protein